MFVNTFRVSLATIFKSVYIRGFRVGSMDLIMLSGVLEQPSPMEALCSNYYKFIFVWEILCVCVWGGEVRPLLKNQEYSPCHERWQTSEVEKENENVDNQKAVKKSSYMRIHCNYLPPRIIFCLSTNSNPSVITGWRKVDREFQMEAIHCHGDGKGSRL